MAKKESRISINKLESVVSKENIVVPMDGIEGIDIVIRPRLSLKDMLQFVEDVVSSCIDKKTGAYTPEIKMLAIYTGILTMYGNFNLPSNAEKQYELVYNTNAVKQVMKHIDNAQLEEIVDAIDARIDHDLKMVETAMAVQLNNMLYRVQDMVEKYESVFGGITKEDMDSIVENIGSVSSITDKSLVKAVYDAQEASRAKSTSGLTPMDNNIMVFSKTDKK